ncbi:MAG: hypothetical protein K2Y32_20155 [Candidatus Obscuribacterales bacterium]|nr:hypothetical protein [Candidatus Obscuribacterales bacterium]
MLSLQIGFFIFATFCQSWISAEAAEAKIHSKEDTEKKLGEINEFLKKEPGNIRALESKVATLQLLGRLQEGLQVCDEALKTNSERGYLWYFKGFCKFKEDKWKESYSYFQKSYDCGFIESLDFLPACLVQMKRYHECIEFSTKAIQRHPEVAALYYSRGYARKYLKHSKDMVCADFKKAADLAPRFKNNYEKNCLEEPEN